MTKEILWTRISSGAGDGHLLLSTYCKMKKHGLLPEFFYDGKIPSEEEFTERFLKEALEGRSWFYVAESGADILGFCYVNNFTGLSGMIHFCIFPQGRRLKDNLTRSVLQSIVKPGALASVYGLTPLTYVHVLRHIKRHGFAILGILPGACYMASEGRYTDGVISVYSET